MKTFFITAYLTAFLTSSVFGQTQPSDSLIIDVSNAPLNQDNPSVSINRKNKGMIVIGAASDIVDMDNNGVPAYTSTDTGRSWVLSRLPLPLNHQDVYIYGEASLACDDAGNFYYSYITDDGADSAGTIAFATSTDGKIWKNATPIDNNPAPNYYGNPDGVFITVDNSLVSSHHGRVYAIWNQYYSADSLFEQEGAYISWSDNKCVTWSTPKLLGPSDDYQIVRTGKNGEIFVAFSDSSGLGHQFFVSTDGGSTFTLQITRIFNSYPFFTSGLNSGFTGLKGNQGFEAFPYPSFDVDINTNRIYALGGDYQGGIATESFSFSDDDGLNWTTPQIIGINSLDSADRFDPCVSVDQATGDAYALYYSSESDLNNILIAPYRIRLGDVLPDKSQMLAPSFNPLFVEKTDSTAAYIGDHTSGDAFGGVYVGSWTQNRTGFIDADIFAFVSINTVKSSVEMPILVHSPSLWLSGSYPNPSDGKSITLSYYIPHATYLTLSLYDDTGKEIRRLTERSVQEGSFTEKFAIGNVANGTYFIRMIIDNEQLGQKFVVHK